MNKYLIIIFILLQTACTEEEEKSSSSTSPATQPPAQTTQPPTIQVSQPETISGYQTVTLDASATTDPDGTIASFFWQPQERAIIATNGVTNAQFSFAAPPSLQPQNYAIKLTVTDNSGTTATETITVAVNPIALGQSYSQNYHYDDLDRVVKVDNSAIEQSQSYRYSASGNIEQVTSESTE